MQAPSAEPGSTNRKTTMPLSYRSTLTQYLIEQRRRFPGASGDFNALILDVALAAYRGRFVPSPGLQKPQVMLSLSIVAADSDEEARLLFSSALQATTAPLPPPVADYEATVDPQRLALVKNSLRHSLVGAPDTIAKGLSDFIARYQPDEIIATAQIFDHAAHMKSLEILSGAAGLTAASPAVPASARAAAD